MMSDPQYLFCLCLVTTVFLFADQNLMAPNLTTIARDLDIGIGLWRCAQNKQIIMDSLARLRK